METGAPDAIFGLVEAFKSDLRPRKVNLGIGVYADDKGDPYVFPVVRKVKMIRSTIENHRLCTI